MSSRALARLGDHSKRNQSNMLARSSALRPRHDVQAKWVACRVSHQRRKPRAPPDRPSCRSAGQSRCWDPRPRRPRPGASCWAPRGADPPAAAAPGGAAGVGCGAATPPLRRSGPGRSSDWTAPSRLPAEGMLLHFTCCTLLILCLKKTEPDFSKRAPQRRQRVCPGMSRLLNSRLMVPLIYDI